MRGLPYQCCISFLNPMAYFREQNKSKFIFPWDLGVILSLLIKKGRTADYLIVDKDCYGRLLVYKRHTFVFDFRLFL